MCCKRVWFNDTYSVDNLFVIYNILVIYNNITWNSFWSHWINNCPSAAIKALVQ